MKKYILAALCAISIIMPQGASAFNLKDIFGTGSGAGSTISNIIEGIFTKSDLKLSDLQGSWNVNGAAVTFKGDNFLEKAGGIAAAAAIENKIDPYFKQYGLTGTVMTIDSLGNASLNLKNGKLNGTFSVVEGKAYNFEFKIKVAGISIGALPTYVEKSYANLNIMFDATKVKNLISIIASMSGNKLAGTAGDILNQYEGMCVGFKMSGAGNSIATPSKPATKKGNSNNTDSVKNSENSSGLGKLIDIFKKKTN